jgi:hypothetical protein
MSAVAVKKKAVALKKKTVAPKKKKAPVTIDPPTKRQLDAVLGEAAPVWPDIVTAVTARFAPVDIEWRPWKQLEFGRFCVLVRKDRRLLCLLPKPGEIEVTLGLGERAYGLALESALPAKFKKLAREAKVYPEGRFIRFAAVASDIPHLVTLLECKMAPK